MGLPVTTSRARSCSEVLCHHFSFFSGTFPAKWLLFFSLEAAAQPSVQPDVQPAEPQVSTGGFRSSSAGSSGRGVAPGSLSERLAPQWATPATLLGAGSYGACSATAG